MQSSHIHIRHMIRKFPELAHGPGSGSRTGVIRKVEEEKVELIMEGDPGLLGLLFLHQSIRHLAPRPHLQLFLVSYVFLTPICVSCLSHNLNSIRNSCHLSNVSFVLGTS